MSRKFLSPIDLGGNKGTNAAPGSVSTDLATYGQTVSGLMSTLGDTVYEGSSGPARLPGWSGTARRFLRQAGTGSASAAPVWDTLLAADVAALLPWVFIPASGDTTGVTDTAAINGAIQAGLAVQLQRGTYYITNLLADSLSSLTGVGPGTILQAVAGTTGYAIALKTPASTYRVSLRDFTLLPNVSGLGGIQLDNTGFTAGGGETDSQHSMIGIYVQNAGGDGYHLDNNIRGLRADRCMQYGAAGYGWYIGAGCTDNPFTACISGPSVNHSFYILGWNNYFTACKGFYAGFNGSAFSNPAACCFEIGLYSTGNTFAACQAQNAALHGFDLQGCTHQTIMGCESDGNGMYSGALGAGVNTNGATYCAVMGVTGVTGSTQSYGVQVAGVQTGTTFLGNTVQGTAQIFNYVSGYGYLDLNYQSADFSGMTLLRVPGLTLGALSTQTLTAGSTIAVAYSGQNYAAIPVTAASAVTGIVLAAPANAWMQATVVNESPYPIIFAASGSGVAAGAGMMIPPRGLQTFTYDGNASLWYAAPGTVYTSAAGLAQITNPSGLTSFVQQSQASATAAVTVTAAAIASLGSLSVPAGDPVAGARYKVTAHGQLGTAATAPTYIIDLRWGGTGGTFLLSVQSAPAGGRGSANGSAMTASLSAVPIVIEAEIEFVTSTTVVGWLRATWRNSTTATTTSGAVYESITAPVTVTTSAAEALTLDWTWGTAASGTTITIASSSFERVA